MDLCTSGAFLSAGVTSAFNYKICGYVIGLTNYAGYMSSTNLWLTGINFNYHLHNYILKNGLSLTTCDALCVLGKPVNLSMSFIDSYFGRNRLYIRHYDEIKMSVIANNLNPYLDYDSLSLGFAFQFGQHRYKAYFLDVVYEF